MADDRAIAMLRNTEAASAADERRIVEFAFAAPVDNDLGIARFWPHRPPIQVSRRQDAPMRSMKLFWFQHLKMSPFSITIGEL